MAQHQSYAHLFSSNAAPIPTEVASVQQSVEIFNTKIKKLKSELQELEDDLQQHRAVLSPLRRIPFEVLGEIFRHSLPYIMGHEDRSQLVGLSLVCRRWRDAALCTHRLWAGVQVCCSSQVSFEKLMQWIERSGTVPKTLDFDMCRSGYIVCRENATSCEPNVATLARLLQLEDGPILDCLSLQFQTTRCLEKLYEAMHKIRSCGAPSRSKSILMSRPWLSVRSVGLAFHRQQTFPASASEIVFSQLPPNMKSFQLDFRGHPETVLPLMPTKFVQRLTSLSFSCNWDECHFYRLLDQCQGLQSLILNLHVYEGFFTDSNDPDFIDLTPHSDFHLPNLHTLTLQKATPHGLNLLSLLHVPALVSLVIQLSPAWSDDETDVDFGKITSFITQSQCQDTFRSLSINDGNGRFEAREMVQLLRGLPTLSHLVLDKVQVDYEELFLQLRDSPSRRRRLPHLEILELRQVPPAFDFDDVGEFIVRRRKGRYLYPDDYTFDGPDSLREVIVTYRKSTPMKLIENNTMIIRRSTPSDAHVG